MEHKLALPSKEIISIDKVVEVATRPHNAHFTGSYEQIDLEKAVNRIIEEKRLSPAQAMALRASVFSKNALRMGSGINSAENGILFAASNLTVVTNTRLRVYEDLAAIGFSVESFPVNAISNVAPFQNNFNIGDPAATINVNGPIMGFLVVLKPIVTLQGFFSATCGFTSAVAIRPNVLFNPVHTPYSVTVQGSAFSDANNTAALYMPAVFATPTLSFTGGVYTQGSEVGSVQNVGLTSNNDFQVSGANVQIQVYPLLATDAVQKAVLMAGYACEHLGKPFTKTFADILYAQFSLTGQITG